MKQRVSLPEIYMEYDSIGTQWKLVSAVANWIMLAGFVVFPSAFSDDKSRFQVSNNTLRIVAICLLVCGYFLTGCLCWKFKNPVFQIEAIFTPGLTNSLIGLVTSLFNVYGKVDQSGKTWNSSAIAAVTLSSVFTLLYGATCLAANKRLGKLRKQEQLYRQVAYSASVSQFQSREIGEEEKTRRNLLSLLFSQPQQENIGPSRPETSYGSTVNLIPRYQPSSNASGYSTPRQPPIILQQGMCESPRSSVQSLIPAGRDRSSSQLSINSARHSQMYYPQSGGSPVRLSASLGRDRPLTSEWVYPEKV